MKQIAFLPFNSQSETGPPFALEPSSSSILVSVLRGLSMKFRLYSLMPVVALFAFLQTFADPTSTYQNKASDEVNYDELDSTSTQESEPAVDMKTAYPPENALPPVDAEIEVKARHDFPVDRK